MLHAEINGEALLDLTTCYGVDFTAEQLQQRGNKDSRIIGMEEVLANIRTMNYVRLGEVNRFYVPTIDTVILGNQLQFIGLTGFGMFSGVNLVIGGSFGLIKEKLEHQKKIRYTRCDAEPKYHLEVCYQDINKRYSHMILTHPHNPQRQVILICVDKNKTDLSRPSE